MAASNGAGGSPSSSRPPAQTLTGQILKLRRKGFSDQSIARQLSVPIDAVRSVLGIKAYLPNGVERQPVLTVKR
jgi:hypothetical protein